LVFGKDIIAATAERQQVASVQVRLLMAESSDDGDDDDDDDDDDDGDDGNDNDGNDDDDDGVLLMVESSMYACALPFILSDQIV
jgi:hypothetical protein